MFNCKFNMLLLMTALTMAMEMQEGRDWTRRFPTDRKRPDGQKPFILVIGETGVGKSCALENLTGNQDKFAVSPNGKSHTKDPNLQEVQLFGQECDLCVMDTCGFNDTDNEDTTRVPQLLEKINEIVKERVVAGRSWEGKSRQELEEMQQSKRGGIHLIVIISKNGSVSENRNIKEKLEMYAQIAQIFGEGWEENAVMLSTFWKDPEFEHSEDYDDKLRQIQAQIRQNPRSAEAKWQKKNGKFQHIREYLEWKANHQIRLGIAQHNIKQRTEEFADLVAEEAGGRDCKWDHTAIAEFAAEHPETQEYVDGFEPVPMISHDLPVFFLDNLFLRKRPEIQSKQMAELRRMIDLAYKNEPMNTELMKNALSARDKEIQEKIETMAALEKEKAEKEEQTRKRIEACESCDRERESRMKAEADKAEAARMALNAVDEARQANIQRENEQRAMQQRMDAQQEAMDEANERHEDEMEQMRQDQQRQQQTNILGEIVKVLVQPIVNPILQPLLQPTGHQQNQGQIQPLARRPVRNRAARTAEVTEVTNPESQQTIQQSAQSAEPSPQELFLRNIVNNADQFAEGVANATEDLAVDVVREGVGQLLDNTLRRNAQD